MKQNIRNYCSAAHSKKKSWFDNFVLSCFVLRGLVL